MRLWPQPKEEFTTEVTAAHRGILRVLCALCGESFFVGEFEKATSILAVNSTEVPERLSHVREEWAVNSVSSIQLPPNRGRNRPPRGGNIGRLSAGLRSRWRQTRRLFHLLIGLAFLLFAAMGASLTFSEWQAYVQTPANGLWRFCTIAGFTLLLLIFGLYSFVKARSVR
jgi:hypothetical protein